MVATGRQERQQCICKYYTQPVHIARLFLLLRTVYITLHALLY